MTRQTTAQLLSQALLECAALRQRVDQFEAQMVALHRHAMQPPSDSLSVEQAATATGRSQRCIRYHCKRGLGVLTKHGYRIDRERLTKYWLAQYGKLPTGLR